MLPDEQIEDMADDAIRHARMDRSRPPDPIRLVKKLVGPLIQLPANGLPRGAFLARFNGKTHVCVRGDFPPNALGWSLLHETAEVLLQREGYRGPDVETVANRLAACLRAPRKFAQARCDQHGPEWSQLALDFSSTESCAALRYGEVTGTRLALLTPQKQARFRGDWFARPTEAALRGPTVPRGLVKARLRDDPSRIVVRASASSDAT